MAYTALQIIKLIRYRFSVSVSRIIVPVPDVNAEKLWIEQRLCLWFIASVTCSRLRINACLLRSFYRLWHEEWTVLKRQFFSRIYLYHLVGRPRIWLCLVQFCSPIFYAYVLLKSELGSFKVTETGRIWYIVYSTLFTNNRQQIIKDKQANKQINAETK